MLHEEGRENLKQLYSKDLGLKYFQTLEELPCGSEGRTRSEGWLAGDRSILVLLARSLVKLYPAVLWEAALVSKKLGYTVQEISKQCFESTNWFLLATYSKIRERN